jgi:hypothetical protein
VIPTNAALTVEACSTRTGGPSVSRDFMPQGALPRGFFLQAAFGATRSDRSRDAVSGPLPQSLPLVQQRQATERCWSQARMASSSRSFARRLRPRSRPERQHSRPGIDTYMTPTAHCSLRRRTPVLCPPSPASCLRRGTRPSRIDDTVGRFWTGGKTMTRLSRAFFFLRQLPARVLRAVVRGFKRYVQRIMENQGGHYDL